MSQSQLDILNGIEADCENKISEILKFIREKEYTDLSEFSEYTSSQTAWLDVYRRSKLEEHDFLKGAFLTFRFIDAMLGFYAEIKNIRSVKFPVAPSIF